MKAYQCKVSVKNSKPPVWWRVFIPARISFSACSLLLDELCGGDPGDGFRFEIFRVARAWEPDEERPLKPDYYHDAYSAAHTPVDRLFQIDRPLYCYSSGAALKIEVERKVTDYSLTYPLLVKLRADMDVQALQDRLKTRFFFTDEATGSLSRREILSEETDGMLHIGPLSEEPIRDKTWLPSSDSLMREMGSYLREAVEKYMSSGHFSMRALLDTYPREDLVGLAKEYKLTGIKNKNSKVLASELSELLLEPVMVRRCFSFLSDEEINAFEAALAAGREYPLPKGQITNFLTLNHWGYAFISLEKEIVSIPAELEALYREFNTEEFHLKRRKLYWVMQCLNEIVPPYYGIIPVRLFSRLCRRTEEPIITAEEVPALLKKIPDEFSSCVVMGEEVCSRDLAKSRTDHEYVVRVQGDKPWYIMREREIAELLQYGYPPHETSYRRFKEYLRGSFSLDDAEIEELTAELHQRMAYGCETDRFLEALSDYDIHLTRRQLDEMLKLLQDMSNNTPTFYNRGYTPNKMAEIKGKDRSGGMRF